MKMPEMRDILIRDGCPPYVVYKMSRKDLEFSMKVMELV